MVKPLELWQRLGHASYRDWVLAAQKARRVAAAAKKAAAKATTPAVQRYIYSSRAIVVEYTPGF